MLDGELRNDFEMYWSVIYNKTDQLIQLIRLKSNERLINVILAKHLKPHD